MGKEKGSSVPHGTLFFFRFAGGEAHEFRLKLPDAFPDDLEFSFLEVLAPTMTLKDYLAMPEQERRKWWISSQIMEPIPLTGPDPETGEDLFVTGFYFEPVAPNIPDRIY